MNITFLRELTSPQIFLIAGISFLFLVFAYRSFSVPAPFKTRALLFFLRSLVMLAAFFILLDPYWKRARTHEWLGVLIDTSKSMKVRDSTEDLKEDRMEKLLDYFKSDREWKEFEKNKLRHLFTFDSETLKAETVNEIEPKGGTSQLLHAVKELDSLYREDPDLLGMIVFSDGAATDDIPGKKDRFGNLSFPWIAVGLGKEGSVPNLEMRAPEVEEHVFVGEQIHLKVHWASTLPPGVKTMLRVFLDDKAIVQKEIVTKDQRDEVAFSVTDSGVHAVDVKMDPVLGEGSVDDNTVRVWLQVSPRQIKVFYAESFFKNKNYFKEALEEDAGFHVTFVSSLIGFSRKWNVPYIRDPLHGFPKSREELLDYDAIILSDVKRNLLTPEQIKWIRELVQEKGGALMMVGGMDSFGDGGYVGTEIEQMLPVEISEEYKKETFLSAKGTSEKPFRPLISVGAQSHPFLQLAESKEENEEIWKAMPLLGGYNYVGRLKPGATLLLQHPVDVSAFGARVILAVQNFGKGKMVAFTSDVTPNWGEQFQDWRDEKHGWLYAQFWRHAIQWLTENRVRHRTVPVEIKREPYFAEEGQPLEFTVYPPEEENENQNESLRLEVIRAEKIILKKEFKNISFQNSLFYKIHSLEPGDYIFSANYFRNSVQVRSSKSYFTVHPSRLESRNLETRHDLLRNLAKQSQGIYLPFSDRMRLNKSVEKIRKVRLGQSAVPFWDQAWLYIFILFILTVDWLIRKKQGIE